jgi:cytochrome c-type biogenesis protein CcmF
MSAELGLILLWIAAALALLQLGVSFSARFSTAPQEGWLKLLRFAAVLQAQCVLSAFLALIWCFLNTDLSVRIVAENSHIAKPLIYKIAGTWGNHEGSMLLWVSLLATGSAAIALWEKRLEVPMFKAVLGTQAALSLGFYGFLLFASNPFARLNPAPESGNGLNPLLQDPGLAFHPPTLYIGYVGMSIAFSFAVAALLTKRVDALLARAMRPWVLGAWVFLTLGITAGSYWSYYILGWGGWWAWDPVENASLMPWLAATALLHCLNVLAARNALKTWTIFFAVLAFSMSMVGTFLVRSGILISVHSFAVDPTRGIFLLGLLLFYTAAAFLLFAWRAASIGDAQVFHIMSREGALVLNNLLFSFILAIVFIGTIYPVVAEALGTKISIGAPFYNHIVGVVALFMFVVMAAGPLLKWRRDGVRVLMLKLTAPLSVGLGVLLLTWLAAPSVGWLPLLGLSFAAMLALASLAPLLRRNIRRTPLHIWAMVLAHLGCAVSLAGMASDSAFMQETLVAMKPGESAQLGAYTVRFAHIFPALGANWSGLESTLEARNADGSLTALHPQARFYPNPPTPTQETAITTFATGQLYAVLGQQENDGRWQFRLWWKPFVWAVWLGGFMIALGGALAACARLWREGRKTRMNEAQEGDSAQEGGAAQEGVA